jgi:type VII secretion-associated protein (TIGR03931 family)
VKMPMTLLVEGRVGVMVPAGWAVVRVTSGPGSARVQVVSPTDADVAVHVTQSSLTPHQSHDAVAESLRSALSQEPDGVFVEFNPSDRRAGQPVVTYREIRADHHIAWAVLVDDSLRIAIGCESAPGHEEAVREVCDQAIRSAQAVF